MTKVLKVDTKLNLTVIDLEEPLYESAQKVIGGYGEQVRTDRIPHGHIMLVDEEGRLKDLPFNAFGSFLYGTDKHGEPIVGDILLIKTKMTSEGEDWTTLSLEEVAKLSEIYQPMLDELKVILQDKGVDLERDL